MTKIELENKVWELQKRIENLENLKEEQMGKSEFSKITEDNFDLKKARCYIFRTLQNKFYNTNDYRDEIIENIKENIKDYWSFREVYKFACKSKNIYEFFNNIIAMENL